MTAIIVTTRVACNTAAGTQNITDDRLSGETVKGVLFFVTRATADATPADHNVWGVGAASGADNERAMCSSDEHNAADTDSYRNAMSDACICILDPQDGWIDGEAYFVQTITNGVQIYWENPPSVAYLLHAVMFAGSDVTAHVNHVTLSSQDTPVDVTDPGFEPDCVITFSRFWAFNDVMTSNFHASVGVAVNGGSQVNHSGFVADAQEYGEGAMLTRNDYSSGHSNLSTSEWQCEISGWDSSGFTATSRLADGTGDQVGYLALAFNSAISIWAGQLECPASTGDQSVTSPGWTPQFVMYGLSRAQEVNTVYFKMSFGVGMFDDTNEYCVAVASEDDADPTDTQSYSSAKAIDFPDDTGTIAAEAVFKSFDANGWTLTYSTAGSGGEWWAVAFQAEEGESASESPSESPSLSPSASGSPSASPSPGWVGYSRGNYAELPSDDSDLETVYSTQDEADVATKNDIRVGQDATGEYAVHLYKNFVSSNSCSLEWEGQTNCACQFSTVHLQIYNRDTPEWEDVDTDDASPAGADFVLSGSIPDLTDYKDAQGVIACRVYQLAV